MKETTLWRHISPLLERQGRFQKISDRFTPGVADVLGVQRGGRACAIELKEFYLRGGMVRADYRPGQIPFLHDWGEAGALALTVGTLGNEVAAFAYWDAARLHRGEADTWQRALVVEPLGAWQPFVARVLALDLGACRTGPRRLPSGPARRLRG